MNQNSGVRKRKTFARGTRCEEYGCSASCLTETDGGDVWFDIRHGVVNCKQRVDVATGAVDVQVDIAIWVLALEVQQLCTDEVGDRIVDWCTQEDDVLFEQLAVEVVRSFASVGLLDNTRDHVVAGVNRRHEGVLLFFCVAGVVVIVFLIIFRRLRCEF